MKQATQDLMESLRRQGTFFPIREEQVKTGSGRVIEGKKVLTRRDDGRPLGIVSKRYKTVTNEEQFDALFQAMDRSGLCLDGAVAKASFAHGGARTRVTMRFPGHALEVKPGDKHQLQITAKNSYDGRWLFCVAGEAFRLVCKNGMGFYREFASVSEYHHQRLDVAAVTERIVGISESFTKMGDEWRRMLEAKVTDDRAFRVFALYAGRPSDFKAGLALRSKDARETTTSRMFESWTAKEKVEIGPNAFSVYNAMTSHATHGKLSEGREAISLDLRMGRVQAITDGEYWRDKVVGKAVVAVAA